MGGDERENAIGSFENGTEKTYDGDIAISELEGKIPKVKLEMEGWKTRVHLIDDGV